MAARPLSATVGAQLLGLGKGSEAPLLRTSLVLRSAHTNNVPMHEPGMP